MSEDLFGPALRAHLRRQGDSVSEDADASVLAPTPTDVERLEALAQREQELATLEHRLAEAGDRLRRQAEEVAAREQELARLEAVFADENRRPVRELLRERAELSADRLWSVFDAALDAGHADGDPDHMTRVSAVQALLSEAYARPAAADDPGQAFDLPEPLR